jgi:hypothetical protein
MDKPTTAGQPLLANPKPYLVALPALAAVLRLEQAAAAAARKAQPLVLEAAGTQRTRQSAVLSHRTFNRHTTPCRSGSSAAAGR